GSSLGQRSQSGRCGEAGNRARASQPRMRREGRAGRNAMDQIARAVLFVLQDFNGRGLAGHQALPDIINVAAERRHPAHSGDAQTHRANFRKTIVAFVPPKPNELETAQSNCASRASFATTLSDKSDSRKLIFGGRNWCCSARRVTTASIAPAAPRECPIMLLVELTG